jgi:hypothetical protein
MIETWKPKKDVPPYYPAVVDIETDRRDGHEIAVTYAAAHDADTDPDVTVYDSWGEYT